MPLLPVRDFAAESRKGEGDELGAIHARGSTPETVPLDGEERARAVRVRNRRKTYLDQHPEYFSSELELADPLLYDRMIRRFQSAPEREAEGRAKGYAGLLEATLFRSEARIEAVADGSEDTQSAPPTGSGRTIVDQVQEENPSTKEEGRERWKKQMEWRFVMGEDKDFDYTAVDDDEALDDHAEQRRDEEENYFDDEEPSWVLDEAQNIEGGRQRTITGETGIQDF